jgi:CBS domain-containing protein
MTIGSICQRDVVTIDGQASLQQAAVLMREHHVGALVVTVGGAAGAQVAGVLTDRDLAIEVLARGGDAAGLSAASIVRGAPVSVAQGASVAAAVERMQAAGVRRLLVHDAQGHLAGIVSFDDLLPACIAPLAGLADVLQRGREREASARGTRAAAPRPTVHVPAMGTAGWAAR